MESLSTAYAKPHFYSPYLQSDYRLQLLCILPLRDAAGQVAYFIGGQVNVTGVLSSYKDIGFLIGGESSRSNETLSSGSQQESLPFSP